VAYIGPHFGEEPPITGTRGSGTVFFTGCSLKCAFCQNVQISRDGMGEPISWEALFEAIVEMVRDKGVHNINFVTPDHFLPHVTRLVDRFRQEGHALPVVMNLSGYQSTEMLQRAERAVDIYLPDYKYADTRLAASLSACPDYPTVALNALSEMLKQKGFLTTCNRNGGLALRGVLARHLILPGHIQNSVDALSSLYVEFGPELPVSLMSQYHPVGPGSGDVPNRGIYAEEFERVFSHAEELGFEKVFVQFPDEHAAKTRPSSQFLPDFRETAPFGKQATENIE
ncbi:MAG: 4Fe-4S cluster-binding domain-containing protein, partial [Deltaproteobacteria bacterium]|nr:4Fe-4S cluster-binding domain-containing protein [Deltaproteobacteria bacterium]